MKTVRFYYVRHGQTLFNVLDRMQGWCDSPLTEKGLQDARDAREILKDVALESAWISTSERCRDTAAIVLEGRDIPVHESKGLKEINFGTFEAVIQHENEDVIGPRRQNAHWEDAGGDSQESLKERILTTYRSIYDQSNDGDHVLIVSHGGVWIWIQRFLLGIDPEVFFKAKIRKGASPMPNGYNGVFSCTDGVWRLEEALGLDEDDIRMINGE